MYCKQCNAYNDDTSRFCANCGAPLQAERPAQEAYAQPDAGQQTYRPNDAYPPQGAYAYQPPYDRPASSLRPQSNALPIVALIVSIVFGNLIGILLGAFALVNFNRYTEALRVGDLPAAEQFGAKSRRLSVAAIVVSAVCLVLVFAAVVAFTVLGVVGFADGQPLVEFNYGDFAEVPASIPAMLGLLF